MLVTMDAKMNAVFANKVAWEFGAVAAERVLQMLARWEIRSTWFIPRDTIDTYPDLVRRIARCGTRNSAITTTATRIQFRSR